MGEINKRIAYWIDFINERSIKSIAEVGVWKGEFAEAVLQNCPTVERYYLIDPWKMLDDWNKPFNSPELESAYEETKARMAPFRQKVTFLRGRTSEVADQLPADLDFAYIDGDHTLRGIVIDMLQVWPKIREGGWLGGDDLSPTIWQHGRKWEPTMVFPFAIHFAEAMGCPITSPMKQQFFIEKNGAGFSFTDCDGVYPKTDVLPQMKVGPKEAVRALIGV